MLNLARVLQHILVDAEACLNRIKDANTDTTLEHSLNDFLFHVNPLGIDSSLAA